MPFCCRRPHAKVWSCQLSTFCHVHLLSRTLLNIINLNNDTMATAQSRPERVVIGGTIEIPRILNGLWQLAGGHDKDVSVTSAAQAMDAL